MSQLTPRKFRSPETWAKVKAAYLAGETATAVCQRFDVGLANLRRRAGAEGWTRADAAMRDVSGPDPVLPTRAIEAPTYRISPQQALERAAERASWLVAEGRSAEAGALLKAARELGALVEAHGMERYAVILTTWDAPVAPAKAGVL